MKRSFRLTRSTDFKRVRRDGKSYTHPLLILYTLKSDKPGVHVGVSAGLAIGTAVQRNRAKRLLRAAMSELLSHTTPGSDLLLIARPPLPLSDRHQTRAALSNLLGRAGLLLVNDDQ